jgi:hypothetical protein
MTKMFDEMHNVGRAKYVVNFHDGVKTHEDGSPFFDIRLFSNCRKKDRFVRDLQRQGYTHRLSLFNAAQERGTKCSSDTTGLATTTTA